MWIDFIRQNLGVLPPPELACGPSPNQSCQTYPGRLRAGQAAEFARASSAQPRQGRHRGSSASQHALAVPLVIRRMSV